MGGKASAIVEALNCCRKTRNKLLSCGEADMLLQVLEPLKWILSFFLVVFDIEKTPKQPKPKLLVEL